jgi:hypothetical protein
MTRGRLPDGWTIERVAEAANDPDAHLLDLERSVWYRAAGDGVAEPVELEPAVIVGLTDVCLVQVEDGTWYAGRLDADGSILCWESYGDDLQAAIDAV